MNSAQPTFDLDAYLGRQRTLVESALASAAAGRDDVPSRLTEAMAYSLLAGGKRLRPILALAGFAATAPAADVAGVLPFACAVEMIHTYSLIHDDLPAMDDDDFRRGRPTNHKQFGEGIAILAGDGLLTDAFGLLARCPVDAQAVVDVVRMLSEAAGSPGMVGGQIVDLDATGKPQSLASLEHIHTMKTGALLAVSVCGGARLAGASAEQLAKLRTYSQALGLAFQIIDDVLDVTADLHTLGKDPGSDAENGKTTYVTLLGVEGSQSHARDIMHKGLHAIESFGVAAQPLVALGHYTLHRKN